MRLLPTFILLALCQFATAQVFLETFDEGDGATTGTDDIGGVAWTTVCPGCIAPADYFEILSGELSATDTDFLPALATFTTDPIDISSCLLGLNISMDLRSVGDLEDCGDCIDPGTDCVDWVKLEYNVDGLGWTESAGPSCPIGMTSAPGDMVAIGDILSDTLITSPCVDVGSTLEIRITVLNDNGAENWFIDNLMVDCIDCLLPVRISKFEAKTTTLNYNQLEWTTATEKNSDYFIIEKSIDGTQFDEIGKIEASGNSTQSIDYNFIDPIKQVEPICYYRLKQVNLNGEFNYSAIISHSNESKDYCFYSNNQIHYDFSTHTQILSIKIYDISGKIIESRQLEKSGSFSWNREGIFIIEVQGIDLRQKIVAH